jgi:hypothetical protein
VFSNWALGFVGKHDVGIAGLDFACAIFQLGIGNERVPYQTA